VLKFSCITILPFDGYYDFLISSTCDKVGNDFSDYGRYGFLDLLGYPLSNVDRLILTVHFLATCVSSGKYGSKSFVKCMFDYKSSLMNVRKYLYFIYDNFFKINSLRTSL